MYFHRRRRPAPRRTCNHSKERPRIPQIFANPERATCDRAFGKIVGLVVHASRGSDDAGQHLDSKLEEGIEF
jgi:hypothetical protein